MLKDDIIKLYMALFFRAAEKDGVDSWYNDAVINNYSLSQLADNMINAASSLVSNNTYYSSLYPEYVNFNTNNEEDVRELITKIYETLFNKTYEDDLQGIDWWVNDVLSHKQTIGEVVVNILNIAEQIARGKISTDEKTYEAALTFENRFEVSKFVYDNFQKADVNNDGIIDFSLFEDFIKGKAPA